MPFSLLRNLKNKSAWQAILHYLEKRISIPTQKNMQVMRDNRRSNFCILRGLLWACYCCKYRFTPPRHRKHCVFLLYAVNIAVLSNFKKKYHFTRKNSYLCIVAWLLFFKFHASKQLAISNLRKLVYHSIVIFTCKTFKI